MASKKYELVLNDTINVVDEKEGTHAKLYRIRALRKVGMARKGDLGGYIEHEGNLSHEGEAWVGGNARVYGHALVKDNALVTHSVVVKGFARIEADVRLYDFVTVSGEARVTDRAFLAGRASVGGAAVVRVDSQVTEFAVIDGVARVHGRAQIKGHAHVGNVAEICDKAIVSGNAKVYGGVICGGAHVRGMAHIACVDARISRHRDVLSFDGLGGDQEVLSAYRMKEGNVAVTYGTFNGSTSKFREWVEANLAAWPNDVRQMLGVANLIEHHFAYAF